MVDVALLYINIIHVIHWSSIIMTHFLYLLIACSSAALTTLVLLPWVLKHAYNRGLYALRATSTVNKNKVLSLGGAVLAPSVLIGTTLSVVLMSEGEDLNQSIKTTTMLLGCGVMMIYLIGLLDDLFGLSARFRFVIQILASVSLPLCDLYLNNLHGFMWMEAIPEYVGIVLTILFVVVMVNAINMIDGIDGLASMFAILCLICFGCCYWDSGNLIYSYIASAMVGALIVFLYFNMFGSLEKKTKTFMGDSGSMMLGFSLAYLSIKFICDEDKGSMDVQERMLLCMSLLFVPCIDLFRVVLERLIHGERLFAADKRHIQYKFMSAGIYGRLTLLCVLVMALVIILVNIVLSLCAWGNTYIFITDITLYFVFVCLLNRRIEMYRRTMALRENLGDKFRENASVARKVCILTPRFPIPENGGDVLRINNIARQLKREGYELVLVSFEDDGSPQLFEAERIYDKVYTIHRNRINSLVQSVIHLFLGRAMQCGYYYSAEYKHLLQTVIEKEKPDIYIAHLLRMMPYLDELHLHDRAVIEMTDALSKTYSLSSGSKGGGFLRQVYAIERHLIRRAEQYAMMYFPVNVLVSEADADYLRTISNHNSSLVVHTNGVDVLPSVRTEYDSNKIVFVGNMRTLQNQDAVLSFVQDVFPRILKRIPKAKFYIVGAQPPPHIMDLACENIVVTGFVDDLAATICDAAVAVAPVRVAAGIQNKVLVAMGCGLPVVLTTLISRAIPELEDDRNCIIRDEAATIADSCVRLMTHPQERTSIANAGYQMVCRHYGWEEKLRGYIINKV